VRACAQPRGTRLIGNICHELGYNEKQSSCWGQAVTMQSTLANNIMCVCRAQHARNHAHTRACVLCAQHARNHGYCAHAHVHLRGALLWRTVRYNGPRAMINFNDGFGGGSEIVRKR
jgi:hypothetical protein